MFRTCLILMIFCSFITQVFAADLPLVDPTRPEMFGKPKPKKVKPKPKKVVVKKEPKKLILQQTIVSGERRFAIINGFTLTEGERVKGGFRVLEINDDNVVLIRQDKELVLYLAGKENIKELSR